MPEAGRQNAGSSGAERRQVHYAGRVQGVGFRHTTRSLAAGRPVVGFVRNLPDGRVELVVEGAPGDLDGLLVAIEEELGRFIRSSQVTVRPASGEFDCFEITF